jgi:hypothetical protein
MEEAEAIEWRRVNQNYKLELMNYKKLHIYIKYLFHVCIFVEHKWTALDGF